MRQVWARLAAREGAASVLCEVQVAEVGWWGEEGQGTEGSADDGEEPEVEEEDRGGAGKGGEESEGRGGFQTRKGWRTRKVRSPWARGE